MNVLSSRRRARAVALAAGVAVMGLVDPSATAARSAPSSSAVPVPVLEWSDCGDGFECATAAVALDYRRPRRETIDISLIRHPASDQENPIGTLFFGHVLGTVDFMRDAPPGTFELLSRFDEAGYDGRGVGPTAIECGVDEALLEPFSSNATRPGTIDEYAMVAAADEYARRCVEAHGDLLSHMTTTTMACDLDVLRAAMGDEQLTFIGSSQGTILGTTYAGMFPARVRAMVFDAPADVTGWRLGRWSPSRGP